jgi:hypothetical protein
VQAAAEAARWPEQLVREAVNSIKVVSSPTMGTDGGWAKQFMQVEYKVSDVYIYITTHVCICKYMYIYVHIFICTHTYMHIHMNLAGFPRLAC